jgi:DNA-binding NarL/FixJ family response regulator
MPHLADPEETGTTRVLLVAHSQILLDVTVDFLRCRPELEVVGAVRGAGEVLACVQDLRPHVILVDMDVANSAGLELIRRLHALAPDVRIIGLALLDGNAYRKASLAAGADAIVSKGAMVQELLPVIRRVALRPTAPAWSVT